MVQCLSQTQKPSYRKGETGWFQDVSGITTLTYRHKGINQGICLVMNSVRLDCRPPQYQTDDPVLTQTISNSRAFFKIRVSPHCVKSSHSFAFRRAVGDLPSTRVCHCNLCCLHISPFLSPKEIRTLTWRNCCDGVVERLHALHDMLIKHHLGTVIPMGE